MAGEAPALPCGVAWAVPADYLKASKVWLSIKSIGQLNAGERSQELAGRCEGFVAPAKAGAQKHARKKIKYFWIPAFAGMTEKALLSEFCINLPVKE